MSRIFALAAAIIIGLSLLASNPGLAAKAHKAPKTYQVTGKVLEVNDDFIAVDKGGERWEVALDGSTQVTGTPAVGGMVTMQYRMTATTVTVKTK
jgi:hypothetical protein